MYKFKHGDIVSQFDDDHSPLCVDDIVELEDKYLLPNETQKYFMYAISSWGFGHTSLDPDKFHLVSKETKKKFIEELNNNGLKLTNRGNIKVIDK